MRFRNSGVKRRRAAAVAMWASFSETAARHGGAPAPAANPSFGWSIALISAAPRLPVMKMRAWEKSTRLLSPSVRVALSRMPSSRFHSASLAFSISSNSTKLSFRAGVWYWSSTSWLSSAWVSR